jgi:hypothetical protein
MNIAYSNKDLEKALAGVLNCENLKIYEASRINSYSINEFKESPYNFFVIYHGKYDTEGHWTCIIFRDDKEIEYFDPLGNKSGYKVTMIKKYFKRHGYTVIANTKRLQDLDSKTCGKWVVQRILSRHVDFKTFSQIFRNKLLKNEDLIKSLVAIEF